MREQVTARVYLKDTDGFREFLWFSEGNDTSLYFGSSITKLLKKGYCGSDYVPVGGLNFDYTQGRKLTDSELKGKTSFHKSGTIYYSTNEDGKRKSGFSVPLIKYEDIVPIASVIPMRIEKYPITKKTIRNTDIVIELSKTGYLPLAIFFYIKGKGKNDPLLIRKIQNEYLSTDLQTTKLSSWLLCALMYSNCRNNIAWPDLQITLKANPDENGKVNAPIFGHI